MTKGRPGLLALAVLLASLPADAGVDVDQGAGNAGGATDWIVNGSARLGGRTSECLVGTSATACPTAPTTALAGRKFVELQNLGPNPIFCSVGGGTPVVNKARRLAPLPASGPADSWALTAGPGIAISCIASTAAQVTGAATILTELR